VGVAARIDSGTDDVHRILPALPADREVPLELIRSGRRLEVLVLPGWDD
jgi:hypothetical protein